MADLTKAIELDELGVLGNMAYNNRGIAYAKRRDYKSALADFNSALRINPNDSLAQKNREMAQERLNK